VTLLAQVHRQLTAFSFLPLLLQRLQVRAYGAAATQLSPEQQAFLERKRQSSNSPAPAAAPRVGIQSTERGLALLRYLMACNQTDTGPGRPQLGIPASSAASLRSPSRPAGPQRCLARWWPERRAAGVPGAQAARVLRVCRPRPDPRPERPPRPPGPATTWDPCLISPLSAPPLPPIRAAAPPLRRVS
jgi:hypothetical protein